MRVDWESVSAATRSTSFSNRLTSSKIVFKSWLATNTYQMERKYRKDNLCPCCLSSLETWDHVFRCKETTIATYRRDQLRLLRENLHSLPTPSRVVNAMLRGLVIWIGGREQFHIQEGTKEDSLKLAIRQKTKVGWKNMIKGRLVQQWSMVVMDPSEGGDLTRPKDGPTWGIRAAGLFIAFGINCWKRRNGAVHGLTLGEKRAIR